MKLPSLKIQDLVDIILPATSCDKLEVKKIAEFLTKTQLKSNVFYEEKTTINELKNHEFAEIDKNIRFKQFEKAANSESKIIWCAKGGYGSIEVLPLLKKIKKPKIEKLFIGFSDITIFNKLLIEKWGWKVILAPMLCQIVNDKVEQNSIDEILNLIRIADDYGFTIGVGFEYLANTQTLDLAIRAGKRESYTLQDQDENYISLHFGITTGEKWFMNRRRKY